MMLIAKAASYGLLLMSSAIVISLAMGWLAQKHAEAHRGEDD